MICESLPTKPPFDEPAHEFPHGLGPVPTPPCGKVQCQSPDIKPFSSAARFNRAARVGVPSGFV